MKTYKEILELIKQIEEEDIQKESTPGERRAARKQYKKDVKKMTAAQKKKRTKVAAKLAKKRVGKAVKKRHLGYKMGK